MLEYKREREEKRGGGGGELCKREGVTQKSKVVWVREKES